MLNKKTTCLIAAIAILSVLPFAGCVRKTKTPEPADLPELSAEMDVADKYNTTLASYLCYELDLDKYDQDIGDLGYTISPFTAGDIGLLYIYLANDINLSALSDEDISTLSGNDTDKIYKVVSDTYQDVIVPEGASPTDMTYYGNNVLGSSGPNMVSANTLVLQIEVSEAYDENGSRTDPDTAEEREEKLQKLANDMQNELDGHLEIPVVVQVSVPL